MQAHKNTLNFFGAFFTMLGQLGETMLILSKMNTQESPNFSSGKMQEFLSNGSVPLKPSAIFELLGVTSSGYSYTMQYLVELEEVKLACGVEQLEIVQAGFPNLARPAGIIHATGSVVKGRRMVAAWRREMRKSLYCLLNREEGTLLADTIEMYFVLVNRRLDFL